VQNRLVSRARIPPHASTGVLLERRMKLPRALEIVDPAIDNKVISSSAFQNPGGSAIAGLRKKFASSPSLFVDMRRLYSRSLPPVLRGRLRKRAAEELTDWARSRPEILLFQREIQLS